MVTLLCLDRNPLRLLDLSKAHPVPSDPLLVRGDVVLKVLLLHLGNAARARLPQRGVRVRERRLRLLAARHVALAQEARVEGRLCRLWEGFREGSGQAPCRDPEDLPKRAQDRRHALRPQFGSISTRSRLNLG